MGRYWKKKTDSPFAWCLAFLFSVTFIVLFSDYYVCDPVFYQLDASRIESASFRQMDFGDNGLKVLTNFAKKNSYELSEVVTVVMVSNSYHLTDYGLNHLNRIWYEAQKIKMYDERPADFLKIKNAYHTILNSLTYFPVPESTNFTVKPVGFENSWGNERTYGGDRKHEGTDVMGESYDRGFYPIISMGDGIVEKMGWLEQGGWRIGIRTKEGAYFYYAHLYSYADNLRVGDEVKSGQLIGYMGDTGYSKVEGTQGNFPVHLHLGVYVQTDHFEEMSVNPYYILKFLENSTLKYDY